MSSAWLFQLLINIASHRYQQKGPSEACAITLSTWMPNWPFADLQHEGTSSPELLSSLGTVLPVVRCPVAVCGCRLVLVPVLVLVQD